MEEEEEVPDVADLQDEDVDDEQGAGAGEVQNKWDIISNNYLSRFSFILWKSLL